jgi:hypothetical protein
MPASRGIFALLALATLAATRPLQAENPGTGITERAVDLVGHVRGLIRGLSSRQTEQERQSPARPRPQAIASGGSSVNLDNLSQPTQIEDRLRSALNASGELRLTVPGGIARQGDFSLGSSETRSGHLLVVDGNADVFGHLNGNLVTVRGDVVVHPGGVISGDVLTLGGRVRDEGGEIGGEVRTLRSTTLLSPTAVGNAPEPLSPIQSVLRRSAGVLGVFLTLALLGFGLVLFGRQNLEIVSDTVSHSFGRAFVTGLLGQILLLPTFGMLVVGLILSVAGILLLPFAVAVFAMLVVVGVVGGYLAVAHAMGETYTRRRMALGAIIGSPNSYRYLLVGLLALASLWVAWALFGWVPVAGSIVWGAAFFASWLLGTAGFGAALLSRAGIKENFAGRLLPPEALTDEYLWATPQFGVPAGRRPGSRTPTRGL